MSTSTLLEQLGYLGSPDYLPADRLDEIEQYAHTLSRARNAFDLDGVYFLRDQDTEQYTPVVYIARANHDRHAADIHKAVWNQNVAPFLLINTPEHLHLYSGFHYPQGNSRTPARNPAIILGNIPHLEASTQLSYLNASALDTGVVWTRYGDKVDPGSRVDSLLLKHLATLSAWLQRNDLTKEAAHKLIGKFVYLRYLRDRGILSDRKLNEWGLEAATLFSRDTDPKQLQLLVGRLDEWLNGTVFPVAFTGRGAPKVECIRRVAAVFGGDDPSTRQLHLDFNAYDFSHIPIELLSTIYEQFLAEDDGDSTKGAYYTPLPVVNLMIDRLDRIAPLTSRTRILDPSCGSGAFLVQCYRRLIHRKSRRMGRRLHPSELRDLLTTVVFGIDRDADACRVAELGLILTMLDNIEPPDLLHYPKFRLPTLYGSNLFCDDFFDPHALHTSALKDVKFSWILGNPPWTEINTETARESQAHADRWIIDHQGQCPVSRRQIAEAFSWNCIEYMTPDGAAGLLLPAMTLFREQQAFREAFFANIGLRYVANLSNLRHILFSSRSKAAAVVLVFLSPEQRQEQTPVEVFSPLLAHQQSLIELPEGHSHHAWCLTQDSAALRLLDVSTVARGPALHWKISMWGSSRDLRLLQKVTDSFPALENVETQSRLVIAEGVQPRPGAGDGNIFHKELIGTKKVEARKLAGRGRLYTLPRDATVELSASEAFLRKRGGMRGLEVSDPPHILVNAARAYAIFSEEKFLIPPRQIGISGSSESADLLRALAAFLSSRFATYHQFMISSEWGVRNEVSTVAALRRLPVPFIAQDVEEIRTLAELQRRLVRSSALRDDSLQLFPSDDTAADARGSGEELLTVEEELNSAVYSLLRLQETERALIDDFVDVRLGVSDGHLDPNAVRSPTVQELRDYAEILRRELDFFLDNKLKLHHMIRIVIFETICIVEVTLCKPGEASRKVTIEDAPRSTPPKEVIPAELRPAALNQCVYFDRKLQIVSSQNMYLLRPRQYWYFARSQAVLDSDELIADQLASQT